MSETITILDPRAQPAAEAIAAPVLPGDGAAAARTVALLHNGNHKFDRVAVRLSDLLGDGGLCVTTYNKAEYGRPAPAAMLAEARAGNGYAVVGLAC